MKTNTESENKLVISYLTLRRMLGILGLSLPLILLVGVFIFGKCNKIEATVSQYYYTVMGDVLVGLLFAISLFLITYKGYDRLDNIITNLAGFFAICIALFPTNIEKNAGCPIITLAENTLSNALHLISASLFFITLAFISIFLFTKTNEKKIEGRKKTRNIIYKTCGIIILISVALIPFFRSDALIEKFEMYKPVFFLEWIALVAFGISWLVKGEMFFADADEVN